MPVYSVFHVINTLISFLVKYQERIYFAVKNFFCYVIFLVHDYHRANTQTVNSPATAYNAIDTQETISQKRRFGSRNARDALLLSSILSRIFIIKKSHLCFVG